MGELRAGLLIALTAATAAITPPVAQTQRVRGTLTDSATGEPVTGAVVSVLDSAGQFLSRTIADDRGRYAAARLRGSRTIHIVRIGYRPVDATIAANDSTMDFRLTPIASRLTAVTATEGRVCPGKPGASQALELWEQARDGLLASVVARESNPPRLRIRTYWRTRDPIRKQIESDSSRTKDIVADRSYVAARPAWAFEAEGYMREHLGGDRDYFAPDEAVLLDPSFAATHCMRVVDSDAQHDNQIGIGFEPADIRARDTVVDLAGTLWLDRLKPSLRSFEFEYTNLESRARGSGGSLTFATMPNGVPMIVRWDIHSAILAIDADYSGVRRRPPPRPLRGNVRVLGYQETGGETGFAVWPDGSHWNLGLSKIFGVVTDQGGTRIPNARVWFSGGRDTVVADDKGEFDFKSQFPGSYVLVASDSALATQSIGRNIPTRVFLTESRDVPVHVILHPRSEILPLVCPASSYKAGSGVVFARLINSDGSIADHARVEVETTARLVRDSLAVSDTLIQPIRRIGEAGDDGKFIVCGAGLDRPLRVRGVKNGLAGEATVGRWIDEIATLTIVLKSAGVP